MVPRTTMGCPHEGPRVDFVAKPLESVDPPHGGLRTFHQKATCLKTIHSKDCFNANWSRNNQKSDPNETFVAHRVVRIPTRPSKEHPVTPGEGEREFFIDNLLVRIHRCFWWTGLAPWEFEFPFPGSLTSTFLTPGEGLDAHQRRGGVARHGSPHQAANPYTLNPTP